MSEKSITKATEKGIEYAVKAQEGFNQKQADATHEIAKRVNQKIDEHGEIIEIVLDELNVQEGRDLYGLLNNYDIKDMDTNERQLLVNILYTLISKYAQNTEQQKRYFFSVKKYLEVISQSDEMNLSFVENIDSAQQSKAILQVVSEFLFLNKGDVSYHDEMEWLFEHFNVNDASIKKINSIIMQVYNTLGINGIINRFFPDLIEEEFFSEVEGSGVGYLEYEDIDSEEMIEPLNPEELIDVSISNILSIKENEIKRFTNNIFHISSHIVCEGELIFQNCIIYYNENDVSDEITLKENAKLTFKHCMIICRGYDETKFIIGESNNEIVFENCIFEDCSNFISVDSVKSFEMKKCQINDCSGNFVDILSVVEEGNCIISNCLITEDRITDFNIICGNHSKVLPNGWYKTLFKLSGNENSFCNIINNTIVETFSFKNIRDIMRKNEKHFSLKYFDLYNAEITNCTFIDIENCIEIRRFSDCDIITNKTLSIKDCHFENCKNVISGNNRGALVIDNCCFEHCTEVICLSEKSKVSYCQFLNCYDSIICCYTATKYKGKRLSKEVNIECGDIIIEFCEFINLEFREKKYGTYSFISLKKGKECSNIVSKCVFNGISCGENDLLIYSRCKEKLTDYITKVEDCTFMNCSTERANGEIINKSTYYKNVFKNYVDVDATDIIRCKGLDKVNKQSSKADNIERKETNISGKKIGSKSNSFKKIMEKGLILGAAGTIGGPIGVVAIGGGMYISELLKKSKSKKLERSEEN